MSSIGIYFILTKLLLASNRSQLLYSIAECFAKHDLARCVVVNLIFHHWHAIRRDHPGSKN